MRKKRFLLLGSVCLILCAVGVFYARKEPPKYYIAVAAIFQNEARFLSEWIAYHELIGVEHFYLFNHLSTDAYQVVLQPYIDRGLVDLYEWPYPVENQKEWNQVQCAAYNQVLKQQGKETFWLAVIDTDEFILPLTKPNLPSFLKEYEECSGIGINWQLYGTSHVEEIPEGKTLIGTLTKRAERNFFNNIYVKTIFRPERVKRLDYPHHCVYKKPYFHVTENKTSFPKESKTERVSVDKIRINHYTYRDEKFFYEQKVGRLLKWYPGCSPKELDEELCQEEDLIILPFVPEVERRLEKSSPIENSVSRKNGC
jgi:hypothetical protein